MTLPTDTTDEITGKGGRTVRMSVRMAAAWTVTRDEFKKKFPGAELPITQGAFMAQLKKEGIAEPDPDSAGYHDLSGALDIETVDLSEAERNGLVKIARSIGWAAWLRGPTLPGGFPLHAHLALLGEPQEVNGKPYVDDGLIKQMRAYRTEGGGGCCGHGGNGLTHDSARNDPHPRPHPIPVFDYDEWIDMKLTDTLKLTKETAEALGEGLKEGDEVTVGGLLQKMARHAALAEKQAAHAVRLAQDAAHH